MPSVQCRPASQNGPIATHRRRPVSRVAGGHRAVERRAGRCRGRRSAPAAPRGGRRGRCRARGPRRARRTSGGAGRPRRRRPDGGQLDGAELAHRLQHRPALGDLRMRHEQRGAHQPAQRRGHRPAATGAPAHTSAAASRVPWPANTASRVNTRRSSGVSRSRLHSRAARSVWCRPGGAPSSAAEQGEAVGEALQHGRQRAVDQRGRGELDGQRHAVEVGDQLGDRRRVLVGEPEPRPDERGPLGEQLDGRRRRRPVRRSARRRGRSVGSGASRQTASPSMSSGSRLVTSTDRCGQCRDSARPGRATASSRCSQLSRTSSIDRGRERLRPAGPRCRAPAARRHPPRRRPRPAPGRRR